MRGRGGGRKGEGEGGREKGREGGRERKRDLKDVHVFIHKCTLHCKVFSCDMYM